MRSKQLPDLASAWLIVLYLLLCKMRQFGTLSIEGDIGDPQSSPLFMTCQKTLREPYLAFALEVFGYLLDYDDDVDQLDLFVELTKRNYAHRAISGASVIDCIGTSARMHGRGATPEKAIRFARMSFHGSDQSSNYELQHQLQRTWERYYATFHVKPSEELHQFIESLFESFDASDPEKLQT